MIKERNSESHNRQSIRVKSYDYSQPGAYFVTICTQHRDCILGDIANGEVKLNELGEIIRKCWFDLCHRYPEAELDCLVVMPNHVHAIIMITDVGAIHELPLPHNNQTDRRRMLIPRIVGYTKMNTTKRINQLRNTPGARVWQRNYYEHVIRNGGDMDQIREYVSQNPLKWALDEENPLNI